MSLTSGLDDPASTMGQHIRFAGSVVDVAVPIFCATRINKKTIMTFADSLGFAFG